jgi:hypothetical protein
MMYSTALEDGKANQAISDIALLERATEIDRVLLTLNRQDFKRLHFQRAGHAGIVICTEDPDRLGQAKRISASLSTTVDLHGKLLRVYRPEGRSSR